VENNYLDKEKKKISFQHQKVNLAEKKPCRV